MSVSSASSQQQQQLNLSPAASDNSPKASQPTSTNHAHPPALDQSSSRSCVTCRRRKVRCNKRSPCSNCVKAGIDCIFPPPGRAPRKAKRPPDVELLSRLRRLEGVIEHLSGSGSTADAISNSSATQAAPSSTIPSTTPSSWSAAPATTTGSAPLQSQAQQGGCPFEDDPKKISTDKFGNEFGRLVIDEGRSRYVNNRLWASLGDEIEELQDILDHSSSEEEDTTSPESSTTSGHEGFLFGFYSLSHSLREHHPPLTKVSVLWEAYNENVAPLIVIVHKPTARNLFIEAAQHPETLDKNSEALVFAMYLSAIVSMTPAQCMNQFGEDREIAVKRYRFAVEQALAKANFLNTQSLVLLQAAVLFLIAVRREDDSKFVWSMTSIVLRLAQSLGIHRDGTNFALKPFETEIRRRLWWHIVLMDSRSSEDHGTDPLINENTSDTRLPLNVNDDELSPDMVNPPEEREGCTDVTFLLIRCEIIGALRRANYVCPGSKFRMGEDGPSINRCERMIQVINDRVEERYIKQCDMNVPIHWAAATVGRLILAKLWLIVHHPMTRRDRVTQVSQATRESLFITAIEVLEFGRLMETNEKTAKWSWLFRTNMQWHGIAFVLSEVCVRPICPVTDRAWNAITSLYWDWEQQTKHKKSMLWRPLAALMKRAAATRVKHQEELRSQFGFTPSLASTSSGSSALCEHPLPRIHVPASQPSPISATQTAPPPLPDTSLNVDLSNGPWEALQDIFPNTNIMATPNFFGAPPPQDPISAANVPTPLPYINNTVDPLISQDNMPAETQLNWEEWDQVMRDFQMEVDKSGPNPSMGTNVTEWFA
ncbi:hypothetical protein N7474_009291 [Penicillium riverlandense]|uniref:uncharacterized protein n=1 Tax=Penicillium riverlandense TaxID=1903569 RepID=UPI002547E7B2|nr:uncharacterized protein N7474_009291 [Penicillium riverlandense]KAJ5808022.1 hypothetical protein N7474_009291 [Penicillium riverlandense]